MSEMEAMKSEAMSRLRALGEPRLVKALMEQEMAFAPPPPAGPPASGMSDEEIQGVVGAIESMFEAKFNEVGVSPERATAVEETQVEVDCGTHSVKVYAARPSGQQQQGRLPCLVHAHGGGMCIMSAGGGAYATWRQQLASRGAVVLSVEFRNAGGKLGPHPYPAGLDDCVAVVEWVHSQREMLNISSVVLTGESGGGNLAIATAMRTRGLVDGVYAQCPFLLGRYDDPEARKAYPSLVENDGIFIRTAGAQIFVRAYGASPDDPLAWPAAASVSDLEGMPPCVIQTNELDVYRDEGLAFLRKLQQAGVRASGSILAGMVHAGDLFAAVVPDIAAASQDAIVAFARSLA